MLTQRALLLRGSILLFRWVGRKQKLENEAAGIKCARIRLKPALGRGYKVTTPAQNSNNRSLPKGLGGALTSPPGSHVATGLSGCHPGSSVTTPPLAEGGGEGLLRCHRRYHVATDAIRLRPRLPTRTPPSLAEGDGEGLLRCHRRSHVATGLSGCHPGSRPTTPPLAEGGGEGLSRYHRALTVPPGS